MFISPAHMGAREFFVSLPFLVGPGSSQVHGPHIGQNVWPPRGYGSQPLQVRLSLSKPPSILIFINSVLPTFAYADTRAQKKHGGIHSTFDKFPTTLQGQLERLAAPLPPPLGRTTSQMLLGTIPAVAAAHGRRRSPPLLVFGT